MSIYCVKRGAVGLCLMLSMLCSWSSVAAVTSGLVFVNGNTPAHTHEVVLEQATTVSLAFSQLPIGGNIVAGQAVLAQGASRLLAVDLNATTPAEVALAPGRYSLLAYVDLGGETVAEVVLSLNNIGGASLYNEQLTVSKSETEQGAQRVTVLQDFTLDSATDVIFSYTSFEHFDVADYFADTATAPAVLISSSDGAFNQAVVLTELAQTQSVSLPADRYTLTLLANIPEQAVAGFFWSLQAGTQYFGDKVLLNGTGSEPVADVLALGSTGALPAAQYELTSGWLMNEADPEYALFVSRENEQWSLSADNQFQQTASLTGDYRIYLVHNGQTDAAVGLQIREQGSDVVRFSDAYPLGDVQKLDAFDLASAKSLFIDTRDYRFVSAFATVQYAITDGSLVLNSPLVTDEGSVDMGSLSPGHYFLLGRASAHVGGNSLVEVTLRDSAGVSISRRLLTAGQGVVAARQVSVSGGRFELSMTDMMFPGPAAQIALGLFGQGNDHRYVRYLPVSAGGVEVDTLDLQSGDYLLTFLIVPDDEESALFGFQLDSLSSTPPTNSGSRGSNGSGGGGGGGTLAWFGLLSLSFLLARRFV
ncbi:MAG: hypothetical protein VYA55_01045 [Pseudomonadota bacterium]|nr:hypothetical protein [Pseudomonadota bacterium]